MAFKTWQSYRRFHKTVLGSIRYIFDEETEAFLSEVLKTSNSRKLSITSGEMFWRAQLGGLTQRKYDCDGHELSDLSSPYPVERMYPLTNVAREGRANPKGISYIYLATTKETAMCEVRPWVDSEISVAQFKVLRDLQIVDCSKHHNLNPLFFDPKEQKVIEPDEKQRELAVWAHIDKAFSKPISINENEALYAPTQILAELFSLNGFDGILYKSTLGPGHNIVLFDVSCVEAISCSLYKASSVSFEFKHTDRQCT